MTTFGESHGGGVGCVIDGVPPRMQITQVRRLPPRLPLLPCIVAAVPCCRQLLLQQVAINPWLKLAWACRRRFSTSLTAGGRASLRSPPPARHALVPRLQLCFHRNGCRSQLLAGHSSFHLLGAMLPAGTGNV